MGDPAVPITPAEVLVTKAYESNSIEEVDSLVKRAIRGICLFGRLLSIQIVQGKYGKKRYEVKYEFKNLGKRNLEEFDKENLIVQQGIGLEDDRTVPNELFYESRNNLVQVEVYAASVDVIALPAVIKRYHCGDLFSANECLQEALLQTRLSSVYISIKG